MLFFYKKFPAHTRAGNLQTKQTNTVIHIMGLSLVNQFLSILEHTSPQNRLHDCYSLRGSRSHSNRNTGDIRSLNSVMPTIVTESTYVVERARTAVSATGGRIISFYPSARKFISFISTGISTSVILVFRISKRKR